MFKNDIINPLDLPNYQLPQFENNFFLNDDTNEFFYDCIEFNNNMHRYF